MYTYFLRTGRINATSEETKNMYKCIFERYEQALKNNNGTDFKYCIMQDVLEAPAPSFYISPTNAVNFYYRSLAYKRSLSKKK